MNKKRILSLVLTAVVILGGSNLAYAGENTEKPAVVETNDTEVKTTFLSDEEALDKAAEAMKYYLNIDTNCYTGTKIITHDRRKNTEVEVDGKKYMVDSSSASIINKHLEYGSINGAKGYLDYALNDTAPSTIFVQFLESGNDEDMYKDNEVTINAETGEVIRISRDKELKEFEGEIDKNKIKESAINILDKAGFKAVEETNWDEMMLFPKDGEAVLCLKTTDGKVVDVTLDLEDYSLINFYKVSIMYPNAELKTM